MRIMRGYAKMETILYLDTNEAFHAATLKKGDRMVVVRPLKEQPSEGYKFLSMSEYVDGH